MLKRLIAPVLLIIVITAGLLGANQFGGMFSSEKLPSVQMSEAVAHASEIAVAVKAFSSKYNALPGDMDSARATKFGLKYGGNADGQITGIESEYAFMHLIESNLVPSARQSIYALRFTPFFNNKGYVILGQKTNAGEFIGVISPKYARTNNIKVQAANQTSCNLSARKPQSEVRSCVILMPVQLSQ